MKLVQTNGSIHPGSPADRRMLTNGLTLIALGLSILFLNSWDSLFVRASVGLFWGTFFLIINGPDAVRVFQRLRQKNDRQRRSGYRSST
jgi:hypothetical protein